MGRFEYAVSPSLSDAHTLAEKALAGKDVLVLAANCVVEFAGRTGTRLGEGERLIVAKPDGSLLVHRSYGTEPVNYQPAGSILSAAIGNSWLTIAATRPRPRESLRVVCSSVFFIAGIPLRDAAEFEKGPGEEEIYRAVSAYLAQREIGLELRPTGIRLGEGFPDLVGSDYEGHYVVVEVKDNPAGPEAIKQLYKYAVAARLGGRAVRGILAAPSVSRSGNRLLRDLGLEFRRLDLKLLSRAGASRARREAQLI